MSITATFNYMNRLVSGSGITADQAYFATSSQRLEDVGYAGLADLL